MTTTEALPEPAFSLMWRDSMYWVSKPNIDSCDCYTATQMHDYAAPCELPDYFELEVYVERGYGCVYLRNPSSDVKAFSDTADGLSHCITQAIEAALKESK